MTVIYYLVLLAPLIVLFAVSYFPLVVLGRWLTKRKLFGPGDAYAQFASALGTALAFLLFGLLGLDRLGLVSEHVRTAWESSGYIYETAQGLFSGGLCAVLLVVLTACAPHFVHRHKITVPLGAVLVSFITFSVWPVLFSPFV